MIQFGYVTLFSSAFPLATVFALINNLLEIRWEVKCACLIRKRVHAEGADGLGLWLTILQFMAVTAVIVNCALMLFTQRIFDDFLGVCPDFKNNVCEVTIDDLRYCGFYNTTSSQCQPLTSVSPTSQYLSWLGQSPTSMTINL